MKKLLILCLTAMLALSCVLAAAEGNMYDKAINFAEFTFGQTHSEIHETTQYDNIYYHRNYYTTRAIADPAGILTTFGYPEGKEAVCFEANVGVREVAGYHADTRLYFLCNPDDVGYQAREGNAKFYAGAYSFHVWDIDSQSAFEDLKSKLSRVYGEPSMTAISADEIWGAHDFGGDEGMANEYQRMSGENQPMTYVVWKSSVNNVMVTLCKSNRYGGDSLELYYLCSDVDAEIEAYMSTGAANVGASGDDLSGL